MTTRRPAPIRVRRRSGPPLATVALLALLAAGGGASPALADDGSALEPPRIVLVDDSSAILRVADPRVPGEGGADRGTLELVVRDAEPDSGSEPITLEIPPSSPDSADSAEAGDPGAPPLPDPAGPTLSVPTLSALAVAGLGAPLADPLRDGQTLLRLTGTALPPASVLTLRLTTAEGHVVESERTEYEAPAPTGEDPGAAADADGTDGDETGTVGTDDAPSTPIDTAQVAAPDAGLLDSARAAAASLTAKGATAVLVDWTVFAAGLAEPLYWQVTVYGPEGEVAGSAIVTTATARTAVVGGLAAGTAYTAEVSELGSGQVSARSAVVRTASTIRLPDAPAGPTATPAGADSVDVSWPANSTGAEVRQYVVQAYLAGTPAGAPVVIDPLVAGTSARITGLASDTSYTITIVARGYDGDSAASAATSVRTASGPSGPARDVTLERIEGELAVRASWSAPAADGGHAVVGYQVDLYSPNSVATGNLVASVEVPADRLAHTFENVALVGTATSPRLAVAVTPLNGAGPGPRSALSAPVTIVATASPSSAVARPSLSAADDTGFTATWNPPAGASAQTGYLLRVVEHLPTNPAATTNFTVALVDAGTGHTTSGPVSQRIDGLNGASRYAVVVTAYEQAGDERVYRASGARSDEIATTGSSVPARLPQPAAPTAVGTDTLAWTGTATPDAFAGGSPISGYRVVLTASGEGSPAIDRVVPVTPGEAPTTEFSGLQRATTYTLRIAAVNANGVGTLSPPSAAATTLSVRVPGSIPPEWTDRSGIEAAIASGTIRLVEASEAGLPATVEPTSRHEIALAWAGAEAAGEVWFYGERTYLGPLERAAGRADAAIEIGAAADGVHYLLLAVDGERPVAVRLSVAAAGGGPRELTDAVFRWGLNRESGNGAFFGGCNFLVAGKAPDVGSGQVFTEARYSASAGAVRIEKPGADGVYRPATFADRCLDRRGVPVTSNVNTPYSDNQVVIEGGRGTVDPATGTARIAWTGDFTVAFYGGLTYWYVSNPVLTIENGVGRLTGTASGFGTSMEDQTRWEPLAEREIVLADFGSVTMRSEGFTAQPAYLGVVNDQANQLRSGPVWGSFPQSFVDFQLGTGQAAYWYSSGGSTDAAKPALPIEIGYDAAAFVPPPAADDGQAAQNSAIVVRALRPPGAPTPPQAAAGATAVIAASGAGVLQQTTVVLRSSPAEEGDRQLALALLALVAALGLLTVVSGTGGGLFASGLLGGRRARSP